MALLITNLVIYSNEPTSAKSVLITVVVNGITGTTTMGTRNGLDAGYLILPTGVLIMISIFPFLFGRCLTISATVNFTKKLTTALVVVGCFFPINSLFAFVLDSVYFAGSDKAGLAIFILLVIHCVFAAGFVLLMLATYRASIKVAAQTLIFHDYLIEYRTEPKGKMNLRHVAPMEEIAEEDSIYEQSVASVLH